MRIPEKLRGDARWIPAVESGMALPEKLKAVLLA
jgi:hypothetical protein